MAKLPSYLAMRVPLLDLGEQYRALNEPIREAIDEVLASHRFILGPKSTGVRKGNLRVLQRAACCRCFIWNGCVAGHPNDAWNWTRRRGYHHAVHIFRYCWMHR